MSAEGDVIRKALEDHAPPRGDIPGCTYCQGALAALDALERERDEAVAGLRQIDAFAIQGHSGGWHFAEVRAIARAALARVQPAEEPT